MTFQAVNGVVTFENRPIGEYTRARIKSALRTIREEAAQPEVRNRLDVVWMQLIRASVEANHQLRKAA